MNPLSIFTNSPLAKIFKGENVLESLNPFSGVNKTMKIIFWVIVVSIIVGLLLKMKSLLNNPVPQYQMQIPMMQPQYY